MKRMILCMLALIMILSLAACGTSAPESMASSGENTAAPSESTGTNSTTGTEEPAADTSDQENKTQKENADTDEVKDERVGKYLLVEHGEDTASIKEAWENKTQYKFIEITNDGTVRSYTVNSDGNAQLNFESTVDVFLNDSTVKYENGKLTLMDMDGVPSVYEKTEEIPDMEA